MFALHKEKGIRKHTLILIDLSFLSLSVLSSRGRSNWKHLAYCSNIFVSKISMTYISLIILHLLIGVHTTHMLFQKKKSLHLSVTINSAFHQFSDPLILLFSMVWFFYLNMLWVFVLNSDFCSFQKGIAWRLDIYNKTRHDITRW